ncbi:unnamed protein product [Orchesella dallaii]|uniref:Uncharacterized protein n=1 Tax=Orchesella dallaii TaxID=48710 RepID=A0ABP1QKB7_9HEXA
MERKLLYETILKLSEDDYVDLMQSVHIDYPIRSRELTNKITNYWNKQENKTVKNARSSGPGCKLVSSLPIAKSSTECPTHASLGDSASGSNQEASSLLPWQKSAWKTGFIFRGDKVPINGQVFIDVEKVTMRKQVGVKAHQQKAATVCLVNGDGKVILWAFIKRNHDEICQYAPRMTNLNRNKLDSGVNLDMVHICLKMCLDGNELVGVSVVNDLISLDYQHTNTMELF